MIIQQDSSNATYQIKQYRPGSIVISHQINQQITLQTYTHTILIKPHVLITTMRPAHFADLTIDDLSIILNDPVAILILGTGPTGIIPPMELLAVLFEKNIGVEFMDSRAACHTYTLLAAEEREVAALIMP